MTVLGTRVKRETDSSPTVVKGMHKCAFSRRSDSTLVARSDWSMAGTSPPGWFRFYLSRIEDTTTFVEFKIGAVVVVG